MSFLHPNGDLLSRGVVLFAAIEVVVVREHITPRDLDGAGDAQLDCQHLLGEARDFKPRVVVGVVELEPDEVLFWRAKRLHCVS